MQSAAPEQTRQGSHPPVFGADDQQTALSEAAEGNALTALTVDGFGFLLKDRVQVLNKHIMHKSIS